MAGCLAALTGCDRAPEAVTAEVRPVRTVTIAKTVASNDIRLTGRLQARA
jgi:hypothetical protein